MRQLLKGVPPAYPALPHVYHHLLLILALRSPPVSVHHNGDICLEDEALHNAVAASLSGMHAGHVLLLPSDLR